MNTRALKATRAILAAHQSGGGGASPLAYVEASRLELAPSKREGRIREAAKILATDDDPVAATEEIIKAYFAEPPRAAAAPDGPAAKIPLKRRPSARYFWNLRRALRRKNPAMLMDSPLGPAPTQDPDAPHGDISGVEIGPHPSGPGDGRSLGELETAARVLGLAVRLNLEISDAVEKAATALRELAPRTNGESARLALTKLANDLDEAVAAAGTLDIGRNSEEQTIFEATMRSGHDTDRALQFSREWDALRGSNGGRGIRMSKAAYVKKNLARESQ